MQYLANLWNKSGIGWAVAAIVSYLATLTGWTEAMVGFVFLVLAVDTVFGAYIAITTPEGPNVFSSRRFARIFQKFIIYFGSAIVAYQFGRIFQGAEGVQLPGMESLDLIAPNIVFSLIAFTEMSSILENAKILGFPVPQPVLDWLQSVNNKLQGK